MTDGRFGFSSPAGLPGRDRRGPGILETQRLDWAPEHLTLQQSWHRVPPGDRASVEEAAGRPFHTWFASASAQHWLYVAVGPGGLGGTWAFLVDGQWAHTRLRRSVTPAHARWFSEIAEPPSRRRDVRPGSSPAPVWDPFRALDETFVQGFGMLPAQTQTFFREPFDAAPAIAGHSFWYSEWEANVITFHVWSFAAAETSVAMGYGWRSTRLRFEATSWDDALGALTGIPLNVRATWWMEPRAPRNPSTAYSVLGLPRGASDAELRASYRQLARVFHPDTASGSTGTNADRFHRIQEAWDAIGSPAARARYDAALDRLRELPPSIGHPGWWDAGGRGRS